jgi:ATP-dependent RNA helicase DOB1
LIYTDTKSESK